MLFDAVSPIKAIARDSKKGLEIWPLNNIDQNGIHYQIKLYVFN